MGFGKTSRDNIRHYVAARPDKLKGPKLTLGAFSIPLLFLALTVNRSPTLERLVVSGFPVSQHRRDLEARLDGEGERGLVLEPNVNGAIIRAEGEFHVGNDLAFDLWEAENAPGRDFLSCAGAGSFMGSHVAS
jgi:hypothetical protein